MSTFISQSQPIFLDQGIAQELNEHQGGSHMSMSAVLDVTTLDAGTRLRLMWRPNRCVVVRYEGHGLFVVEDNVNSKLRFGDTFRCFRIIAHEPLLLTELRRPGMAQCSYICGERGGVIYDILK